MRVAVASTGTYRHILSQDLGDQYSVGPGTLALCAARVDIEVTVRSSQYLRTMRLCHKCLDMWIRHLASVSSLVGEKAEKRLKTIHKRQVLRLAIRPLEGLAGAFRRRHQRRKAREGKKTD